MKKILSLLLAASILITTGAAALAATPSDKALFDVTSLEIMQGDENGDMMLDKELTRAEFATVISNLEGAKDVVEMTTYKQKFDDVHESDWYGKVVTYITDMNIMIGCAPREFCPQNAVTLEQAVKTIVVALGYDSAAVAKGGYPGGYMMQGASLGLTKSINTNGEAFTRGDLVTLIYNALDVNKTVVTSSGNGMEVVSTEGSTFREDLTSDKKHNQLSKGSDVVNATYAYWLTEPDSSMKADEVMIGKQVYKMGDTQADEYLGMMVDFYARENEDGSYTLQSITPKDKKNEKVQIDSEDVASFDYSQLKYYTQDDKEKIFRIANGATVVRNGEVQSVMTDSIFDVNNGIITVIDNNGDSNADVVIIEDYTDVVINTVKSNVVYFLNNQKYEDKKYFKAEEDDVTKKYIITDAQGSYIDIKDMKPGSVMSIFSTKDKSYYRVAVNETIVEGTLEAKGARELTINGKQYKYDDDLNIDIKAGQDIKAYINFRGYVCYVEEGENLTNEYGYIVKTWTDDDATEYVRVLKGATIKEDIEKDNQDIDADEIPVLICQNESVADYPVSNKLAVDGSRYEEGDDLSGIVGKVYELSINKDNEVRRLDSLEIAGGRVGTGLVFNVRNQTFGSVSGVDSFAIDKNTKAICIPKEDTGSKDDYMVQVKLDNTDSTRKYIAQGYELNTDTKKVKLMVVTEDMKASSVTNVNIDTCKIGFVTDSYLYADAASGEVKTGLKILVSGEEKEYETVDLTDVNRHLENLQKGDLIFFAESNTGKLENAVVMQNITRNMGDFFDKNPEVSELRQKGYYTVCGNIEDVLYDEVKDISSENTNYIVDEVLVDADGAQRSLYLKQRGTPPIFLYETGNYKTRNITTDDIIPGEDQMFAIITNEGLVKACVVIRNV